MTNPADPAVPQGTILVVDDDRLVLATLVHGLAQAGYRVLDADNGDDAILLAREHRPDLALLDIRMEGKSGFDVAAYLRDHCLIPFMFLSAFADEATIRQVKALGAVAYLVKPLDIGQIVPAVEAAFANIETHRRALGAPATPAPRSTGMPAAGSAAGLVSGPVDWQVALPIAVGILMHRYSLARRPALEHLQRLATAENRSLAAQAERVIDAVELLAGPPSAG